QVSLLPNTALKIPRHDHFDLEVGIGHSANDQWIGLFCTLHQFLKEVLEVTNGQRSCRVQAEVPLMIVLGDMIGVLLTSTGNTGCVSSVEARHIDAIEIGG